ncbi:MAG: winged helix-turn-helix domain-containing protein [Pseudonocardia sp.]|nr:winged helix-turn-helix domain-containing protein [Pseudonocardia sp.]
MLGVRRPSLNKVLRQFEHQGLIGLGYRTIDVHDRPGLARAAGQPTL